MPSTRRNFLTGVATIGVITTRSSRAFGFKNANDRPRIAVVGCGSRWDQRATLANGPYGVGKEFPKFGDIVAVCDVDKSRLERAVKLVKEWLGTEPEATSDYRKIIDRDDIDIVHVSTPDHWHAKVAVEAMLSGRDVYCEKPMTLTIAEGQQLSEVYEQTGRILQVGTQQRSMKQMLTAIALIRAGRLGTLRMAQCAIGGGPTSPNLPTAKPPKQLDWDRWTGPAPLAQYRTQDGANNETKQWSRGHYEFRWWYEYSGGKLTDWGAHHVDIATWGLGKTDTGPVKIDPIMVKHPVEFRDGMPTRDDCYNTATEFNIKATFADDVELILRHDTGNGILFEGTEGRIFVNRGRLTGRPVEDLKNHPLPDGTLEEAYGRELTGHVENFFRAVVDRRPAISEPTSHHRSLTTCHLAGIAARLGRQVTWDPGREKIANDELAQSFVSRASRKGYEIELG